MNLQSILLLAVILFVACLVGYRHYRRQRRTGGCGSCNCQCDSCEYRRE